MRLPRGISRAIGTVRSRVVSAGAPVAAAVARAVGPLRRPGRRAVIVGAPLGGLLVVLAVWGVWRAVRPRAPTPSPVLIPAAVVPAPRPTRIVRFAEGCMTAECHGPMANAHAVHAPTSAGACDACHAPDAGGHTYPLRVSRDALCVDCHDTPRHGAFEHQAVREDGCLTCHEPHASSTPFLLTSASIQDGCARCHPRSAGSVSHRPWADGQCIACHDPHGTDAPGLLVGAPGSTHCATCHEPVAAFMEVAAHSHAGIEGECLACHGAHATNHPALLAVAPRDGCVECHADVGTMVAGAVVSHDAVLAGDQCVSCHVPHGSPQPRMLRDDQAAVCLRCHNKPVVAHDGRTVRELASEIASAPVVHGAVTLGGCADCHSVHGGGHARLLKQVNEGALVDAFDIRNYALCFACHDPALATDESAAVTLFRDGATNLHRAHLPAGERSRGCASCHAAHASTGPRLIAEAVPYEGSGWLMPVGFTLTKDGGGCAPGCHEPLSYSRTAPIGARPQPKGGAP